MATWARLGGLALAVMACAACAPGKGDIGPSDLEFNRPPANAFEEAFSHEPGVQRIRWGGWLKTLTEGSGDNPGPDDRVRVNYRGTLTDGTEFDSSYRHGEPAVLALSNVIPCWTNGLMMMKPGGKAKFVCPAAVAYGEAGSPPRIPGGATIVFEIEFLGVVREKSRL